MKDKVISMSEFMATREALEGGKQDPEIHTLDLDAEYLEGAAGLLYALLEGERLTVLEMAEMYMGLFIGLEPLKNLLVTLAEEEDDA